MVPDEIAVPRDGSRDGYEDKDRSLIPLAPGEKRMGYNSEGRGQGDGELEVATPGQHTRGITMARRQFLLHIHQGIVVGHHERWVIYRQALKVTCLSGCVGYYTQWFGLRPDVGCGGGTDPARLTLLACVGALLAGRQGPNTQGCELTHDSVLACGRLGSGTTTWLNTQGESYPAE